MSKMILAKLPETKDRKMHPSSKKSIPEQDSYNLNSHS